MSKSGFLSVGTTQRYCILDGRQLLISRDHPEDDAMEEDGGGSITPLQHSHAGTNNVVELDARTKILRDVADNCSFTLRTGTGVGLCLAASDPTERDQWVAAMRECVRALRVEALAAPRRPGTKIVHGNGIHFELDEYYEAETFVGAGGFGAVLSAIDRRTQRRVAVKKVGDAFDSLLTARRAVREVRLMRQLRHRNLLLLVDVLPPPTASLADFEDVYIVSELMDTDLAHVVRGNLGLTPEHVRWFLYQMTCAVHYLHSAGVAHRDLKPANIFVNRNCDLRVGDFGHARSVRAAAISLTRNGATFPGAGGAAAAGGGLAGSCAGSDDDGGGSDLTDYVVTRWYRAPEVLLAAPYGCAVDVWSLGCIFGELLGGKPLFRAASYVAMLRKITALVGSPSPEAGELSFLECHPKALRFLAGLPQHPPADLAAAFPAAPPEALDLLRRMLCFDHTRRITAAEALAHPYLAPLHDATREEEVAAPRRLALADIEQLGGPAGALRHGAQEVRIHSLKAMLLQEIAHFHPEVLNMAVGQNSGHGSGMGGKGGHLGTVAGGARSCGDFAAEAAAAAGLPLVQPAGMPLGHVMHERAVSMPMAGVAAAGPGGVGDYYSC